MSDTEKKIGLIAGSGQFPIIFSKKAKSNGFRIVAVAFHNETDPELSDYTDKIKWLYIGQIKRLIDFFHNHNISEAVMMGAIKKTRLFKSFRPDTKAISLLTTMHHTHDDGILRSFANLLEKEGICIKSSTFLLPDMLAKQGVWTKRKPNRSEKKDIFLGWTIAKEIGRLDVGQCVVVERGSVLAMEAVDGTDATIRRGGRLGNGNAALIKVCKPTQDDRFDIPAVGVQTVRTMKEAGVKLLAIEAEKAVVFDKEEMIQFANEAGLSIIAVNTDELD